MEGFTPTLVLSRLNGVKKTPGGWQAQCPAHDDRNASLSVGVGEGGRTLLHCHANCTTPDVVKCIGLELKDLMPQTAKRSRNAQFQFEVAYDYYDEGGELLFQVCRGTREGKKQFLQRTPNGKGGWKWKAAERLVLYRLPQLLASDASQAIYVVEGEKDAENLVALGLIATTSPGGAGKWASAYVEPLRDRDVIIIPDNDKAGANHADDIVQSLVGIAASVKVLRLPDLPVKGDVSDWLAAGGTAKTLLQLSGECPKLNDLSHGTGGGDSEDHEHEGKSKESKATQLLKVALDACDLWHTPDGDAYATILVGDHYEHHPVRSKLFRRWLQRINYTTTATAISTQAVQDVIGVLEGKAIFDGDKHPVFVRIAEHDGKVYYDLVDDRWRAIEIDDKGWRIVEKPPVRFRRAKAMLPLPEPQAGGSAAELRRFLNVSDADWPIVLGWSVAALFPRGPYPVLVLSAEHGSGKTTASRVLRSIIDPNCAPVRSEPRDPRDLMIAANNGWAIVLDNLSHVPAWLSDCLCRMSTGGGFSTRTLYENDEETIFTATRPVILNGIEDVVSRADLLDRSLMINLPTINEDQRLTESDFWTAFHEAQPRILGALFTALSVAIRRRPTLSLPTLPRMADFAILAAAAEPGLGLNDGSFITAYASNRDDANLLALESSSVAKYLIEIANDSWEGTASELLVEINRLADDATKRQKAFPANARALSGTIKRLAPNLRRAGVEIEQWKEGKQRRRLIRLDAIRTEANSSVRTVRTDHSPRNPEQLADASA